MKYYFALLLIFVLIMFQTRTEPVQEKPERIYLSNDVSYHVADGTWRFETKIKEWDRALIDSALNDAKYKLIKWEEDYGL